MVYDDHIKDGMTSLAWIRLLGLNLGKAEENEDETVIIT